MSAYRSGNPLWFALYLAGCFPIPMLFCTTLWSPVRHKKRPGLYRFICCAQLIWTLSFQTHHRQEQSRFDKRHLDEAILFFLLNHRCCHINSTKPANNIQSPPGATIATNCRSHTITHRNKVKRGNGICSGVAWVQSIA